LDFNNIIKKYNLKKIKISGKLVYYVKNECNILYFLPFKIYQNLIITTRKFCNFFLLDIYLVDDIKEIIKCFMESKYFPSSKYVLSTIENMSIKFVTKPLLHNINNIINIDYIILEEILEDGKYKYKLPFSNIYIKKKIIREKCL